MSTPNTPSHTNLYTNAPSGPYAELLKSREFWRERALQLAATAARASDTNDRLRAYLYRLLLDAEDGDFGTATWDQNAIDDYRRELRVLLDIN